MITCVWHGVKERCGSACKPDVFLLKMSNSIGIPVLFADIDIRKQYWKLSLSPFTFLMTQLLHNMHVIHQTLMLFLLYLKM